ncbi:MAG TPA: PPC domain-containing protein, partial [Parafilimonas sp.]|nr:PPC domain-containing protein [Parafilimonas sp.]
FILISASRAAETEPNNDRASANTLALNGNNTGVINPAGDQDWWKVTTTADGKLDITLTPLGGHLTWIYLYDNNGTSELASSNANTTFTVTKDGLAAGTYYIKIICYFASDTSNYNISDALTTPAQANDAEPNDTKAQAITLALNNSTTGHAGYYYNLHRDTSDWYKLTTNADGRIQLSLTPANGKIVWVYLYDNNGTTLLTSANSGTPFTTSKDGLAAGTYYVRVICYFANSDYAPYTLKDSLFTPTQANDVEPNDSRATAVSLAANKKVTGHVGYYYNLKRDTADWYKITLKNDGLLRLSLTPHAGFIAWIYLYDNNGTTVIASANANNTFTVNADGLAAGIFYVKVSCYFASDYTPYTLTDTLFTYANAQDAESNARPYLAKTMPANGTSTGHVGFYYNNSRDTVDWWKINYTGTGALTVIANFEPRKVQGTNSLTYMEIWKDTLAAPIYSNNTDHPSLVAQLNSLTQGYYWVRVRCYFASEFQSYSLLDTFTQVNIAAVKATSYDTAASCSNINSVTFSCSGSSAPYTVKLYRYNVLYATKTAKVKNITFDSLPVGSYYAKAWGDGATGNAF